MQFFLKYTYSLIYNISHTSYINVHLHIASCGQSLQHNKHIHVCANNLVVQFLCPALPPSPPSAAPSPASPPPYFTPNGSVQLQGPPAPSHVYSAPATYTVSADVFPQALEVYVYAVEE